MSRVLSRTTIYLRPTLPLASSAQPERGAGNTMALLFAFAPDGACQAVALPRRWWSLTPPFQLFPLRGPRAGQLESSFLRRFPSGYPARPLVGILPCGARTFLMTCDCSQAPRSSSPPRGSDCSTCGLPDCEGFRKHKAGIVAGKLTRAWGRTRHSEALPVPDLRI